MPQLQEDFLCWHYRKFKNNMILEEEKTIYVIRAKHCDYVHVLARFGRRVFSQEAIAGRDESMAAAEDRMIDQANNWLEFIEETGFSPYEDGIDMRKHAASGIKKYPIIIVQ